MKRIATTLGMFASVLTLTACSGVLTSDMPARQEYLLMPLPAPASTQTASGPSLSISISAVPGLDTNRILALGPDAQLNHYANARWPDHLPEVLTSVMQRSLVASGKFPQVKASARPGDADGTVNLELQQFYGIQGADGSTSTVEVELAGTLTCGGSDHAITLSASRTVSEERLSAVIAAHQAGLDDVTHQLIKQISMDCA